MWAFEQMSAFTIVLHLLDHLGVSSRYDFLDSMWCFHKYFKFITTRSSFSCIILLATISTVLFIYSSCFFLILSFFILGLYNRKTLINLKCRISSYSRCSDGEHYPVIIHITFINGEFDNTIIKWSG